MALRQQESWFKGLTQAVAGAILVAALVAAVWSCTVEYGDLYAQLLRHFPEATVKRHFTESDYQRLRFNSLVGAILASAGGVWLMFRAAMIGRLMDRVVKVFRKDLFCALREIRVPMTSGEGLTVIVLTAVGAWLRWHFMGRVMRYDETVTFLRYASKPIYIAVAVYNEPNNHIFHTALVKASTLLLGNAEWAIRLPAFLAGVLLIPGCYCIAKSSASAGAGIWAAAFAAVSPYLVEYSVNARGYTIQALMCLGAALLLHQASSKRRIIYYTVAGACLTLGMWTIPTMLFCLLGLGIYFQWAVRSKHCFTRRTLQRRYWIVTAGALLLTAVLYSPVVINQGVNAIAANRYVAPRNIGKFISGNMDQSFYLLQKLNCDLTLEFAGTAVLLCLAAVALMRGCELPASRMFLALLAGTVLIVAARRMVPPARVYLFLLPFFYCLAGTGLSLLLSRFEWMRKHGAYLVQVGAVAFVLIVGWNVRECKRVWLSDETGVLLSAREIASELEVREICFPQVEGHYVSRMILEYYMTRSSRRSVDCHLRGDGSARALVLNAALTERYRDGLMRKWWKEEAATVLRFSTGDVLYIAP